MVFYINNGLCAANEQLPSMVWTESIQFLIMEYHSQRSVGRFFVEFDCYEEFYDLLNGRDFLKQVGLGDDHRRALSNMRLELVLLMSM